ncbi:an EGF domain followed by 10 transmembrane domains [Cryptosporidium sp. chipmunk genotype I]|uniref:an EGF domain followed by 10 transmembrane domains n=1 Tax=Cryptosporidium sp. chipmunk genotype I TaxID=1280935 RepID=UPI00351A14C0|nr:an EGF domain followed by 10 transmembrane domains [Cryptosporidium sp. chipmunk genotype I]
MLKSNNGYKARFSLVKLVLLSILSLGPTNAIDSLVTPCKKGNYFDGNQCLPCPEDTVGLTTNLYSCSKCPINSSTYGATGSESFDSCICNPGYFKLEKTNSCISCPVISQTYFCPGKFDNDYCQTDEKLKNGGWWLSDYTVGILIKCPHEEACLPECKGCKEGYTGPLCNTCTSDYFPLDYGLEKVCVECPNQYFLLVVFIGMIAIVLLISYGIARVSELSIKYTALSRRNSAVIAKFKNLLFFISISTTYGIFVKYKDADFRNMDEFFIYYLKILKLLAPNLWFPMGIFPSKCLFKLFPITMQSVGQENLTDANADLFVANSVPILGIAILFIVFTFKHIIDVSKIYKENDTKTELNRMKVMDSSARLEKFNKILKDQTEKSTYRFICTSQVFLTLIYSTISWSIIVSMTCTNIPGFGTVQSQCYTLPCKSLNNDALIGYIYYCTMFPLINIISGFAIRKKIIRQNQLYAISSSFLFSGYKISVLYWESFRFYIISGIINILNLNYVFARYLIIFALSIYSVLIFVESIISPVDDSDSSKKNGMDKPWWIFSTTLNVNTIISGFTLIFILCLLCIYSYYPKLEFVIEISIMALHIGTALFMFQQVFVDTIFLIHQYNKHKQLYGDKEQILDAKESNDGMSLYYKHKLGDNEQTNFMLGLLKSPFPEEAAAQMLYLIEQGNIFDCEAKEIGKLLYSAGFYEPQGQTLRYLIPKIKGYRSNSDFPVEDEIELLGEVRKCIMNTIRILGIETAVKNSQFRAKGARVIFSSHQFGESTLLKTASDDLFKFLSDVRCSNLNENKVQTKSFKLLFPDALPMVYPDDEEFRLRIIDARMVAKEIRKERNKKLKEFNNDGIYDKVFGFNIPVRPDVKELLEMKRLNELILPPRWDPLDGRLDHEFDHARYIKIRKQFEDILPIAGTSIISSEEVERNFMKWYNEGLSIESSKRYSHTSMVGSKYFIDGDSEVKDFTFQSRNGKNMNVQNNRQGISKSLSQRKNK